MSSSSSSPKKKRNLTKIESSEERTKNAAMVCTKLNLSVDKYTDECRRGWNFGPSEMKEFQNQLDEAWVNPRLYCFEILYRDERKNTRSTNAQSIKRWNERLRCYDDGIIILHCQGTAIRDIDTHSTRRIKFEGYPFTTTGELTPSNFVVDRDSHALALGLGYTNKEGVIYLREATNELMFEDDCLDMGTFDLDKEYASMHTSGNGWVEIEGVPFIKDPVKKMK